MDELERAKYTIKKKMQTQPELNIDTSALKELFTQDELINMLVSFNKNHVSLVKWLYDNHLEILRDYEKKYMGNLRVHFLENHIEGKGVHPKIFEMSKKFNIPTKEFLLRADGRVEWLCEHGIGHTVFGHPTHGCDGCCKKLKENKNGG